ncbi:hypothetical protein LC608_22880 [Nostoc sp. XA010]|uniref:hypothetical protein n=1 Tax=Nostoc sp. XA010 TaxID=2780407 RepID=UPI001E5937BF|nr:hypothetical protein [Nostoc sp. XA010]MCC5659766.1 hypothetical protein [Nostoc sp. XA010]
MSVSRKTSRNHAKKIQRPMVEDEVIASQLEALLTPGITSQENYYRQLGLRDIILNLPLIECGNKRYQPIISKRQQYSYVTLSLELTFSLTSDL